MVRFLEDLTATTCILTCLAFLHLSWAWNFLSLLALQFKLLFYIPSCNLTSILCVSVCLEHCCFQTSVANSKVNNLCLELEHLNLCKQNSVKFQLTKARITVSFINIFDHALVWQPSGVAAYCWFSGLQRGNVEQRHLKEQAFTVRAEANPYQSSIELVLRSWQMLIGILRRL